MSDAFREQLLKAGLVTKKAAKAAAHEQNASRRTKRKKSGGIPDPSPEAQAAQAALEEKRARDKALNQQREAEKRRQALSAEVDDLIAKNILRDTGGEIAYKFVDGGVVKTIQVRSEFQRELAAGTCGIVHAKSGYGLVPRSVALKIEDRVPERLVLMNDPEPDRDEADPYSDYKVPDDLMW